MDKEVEERFRAEIRRLADECLYKALCGGWPPQGGTLTIADLRRPGRSSCSPGDVIKMRDVA